MAVDKVSNWHYILFKVVLVAWKGVEFDFMPGLSENLAHDQLVALMLHPESYNRLSLWPGTGAGCTNSAYDLSQAKSVVTFWEKI